MIVPFIGKFGADSAALTEGSKVAVSKSGSGRPGIERAVRAGARILRDGGGIDRAAEIVQRLIDRPRRSLPRHARLEDRCEQLMRVPAQQRDFLRTEGQVAPE